MSLTLRAARRSLGLILLLGWALPALAQPAPPTPAPYPDAVRRAADDLFGKATLPAGPVELVIDPLIDGVSGAQSAATRAMQETLAEVVRTAHPRFTLLPFNSESLARKPVVLVGTFTAINNLGDAQGPRDAFRICFTLADLEIGRAHV